MTGELLGNVRTNEEFLRGHHRKPRWRRGQRRAQRHRGFRSPKAAPRPDRWRSASAASAAAAATARTSPPTCGATIRPWARLDRRGRPQRGRRRGRRGAQRFRHDRDFDRRQWRRRFARARRLRRRRRFGRRGSSYPVGQTVTRGPIRRRIAASIGGGGGIGGLNVSAGIGGTNTGNAGTLVIGDRRLRRRRRRWQLCQRDGRSTASGRWAAMRPSSSMRKTTPSPPPPAEAADTDHQRAGVAGVGPADTGRDVQPADAAAAADEGGDDAVELAPRVTVWPTRVRRTSPAEPPSPPKPPSPSEAPPPLPSVEIPIVPETLSPPTPPPPPTLRAAAPVERAQGLIVAPHVGGDVLAVAAAAAEAADADRHRSGRGAAFW